MRIFFFDIDCLRPDHLGCYGYNRPTSPTLDSLAREGIRFTNYHCADAPCLPSRMGLVSGRFGIHNGVVSNHSAGAQFHVQISNYRGPDPRNELLMRQMRRNNYDTYSFSNFADRHSAMWFMNGWTEFHTINLMCGSENADMVNEVALRWLRQNAKRENYFLHINYWDAHRTYKMDSSWAERFRSFPVAQLWPDEEAIKQHQAITGPFTATGQFPKNKSTVPLMPGAVRSRAEFEQMVTGYDAAIAYVDDHVRVVLEELDRQRVLDDAVIIISADHGDAFGEHGIYSDHVCADECINRIPLIVRWPGVTPPGQVCDALFYNIDFSATLLEMIGATIPEQYDGHSFLQNLKGQPSFGRDYLVWGHALYTVQRAARTREHLMIRTYDNCGYHFEPVELYNLEADPYQTRNLAGTQSDLVAQHDHLLTEWLQEQMMKEYAIPDPFALVLQERAAKRMTSL